MRRSVRHALLIAGALVAPLALADGGAPKYPATLAGHALLPAMTLIPPPADAPSNLKISGRYTAPDSRRRDQLGSLPANSALGDRGAPRPTGQATPLAGQPVQGFSGIKWQRDGTAYVLTDNGFGSKANSPDAMLMFHRVRPDWKTGRVARLATVFLHDPDRLVPFPIANEGTAKRYLTGSDFDPESIQLVGDSVWIGDEFGPYLIRTDRNGKVTGVFETQLDGRTLRSPDHFGVTTPAMPGGSPNFNVRRSKGYEGMAASPDGRFLYPMLEGPAWDEQAKAWEMKDGRQYLRVLEFDVRKSAWTGRSWKYLLEANGNSIGDFNMIDAETALVIERDDTEGSPDQGCNGPPRADCFNVPAKFKRVYKIDLKQADAEGFVRKVGYIDLMDIADPNGLAKQGGAGGRLAFPFFTIENVDIVDADHIVVGNDNNLPFSSGRALGRVDDNEFVLLRVPELLRAR